MDIHAEERRTWQRYVKRLEELGFFQSFRSMPLAAFVEMAPLIMQRLGIPIPSYAFSEKESYIFVFVLYAHVMHHVSSNPVFEIEPDLATALVQTDLPNVSTDLIHAPFECLLLRVPRGTFPDPEVTEIYVMAAQNDKLRILYMGNDTWDFFSLELGYPDMETAVRENVRKYGTNRTQAEYDAYHGAVFRFTISALLYLDSLGALVEKKPQPELHKLHQKVARSKGARRAELQRKLDALKHKIFLVGRGFRIAPELRLTDEGKAWALKHRFMVRGHHRWQACGRQHAERKWIWIAPHWKGPDMAEILARNYVVREEKKQ